MKSRARPTTRQRLPEAERRAQILQAALAVARRDGIAAVTARSVAAEAGMSQGLVFFHFETRDQMVAALIAHITETTLGSGAQASAYAGLPGEAQIAAFLGDRLANVDKATTSHTVELLADAWITGLRMPDARKNVRDAAARYRASFLPIAEAAIAAEPKRFEGVSAETLSAMALSVVLGTAIQATLDRKLFDPEALRRALLALLGGRR